MRPKPRKPGQSIKDYRAMVKRMEERFSGRGSTREERLSGRKSKYPDAEKRILALVEEYKRKPKKFATPLQDITLKQKAEILKQRKIMNKEYLALTPAERKRKQKEAQEARRRFEKQNRPPHASVFPRSNPKPIIQKQNTIEEENRIRKKNRVEHSTPLKDLKPTQTKPYIARPPKKSSTSSLGKLFSKAKPASTRTPTSLFGSVARGPKKYNQAAYLSGLNTPSNTKKQSIYKPYAKGGGIRKPKYKD